MADVLILNVSAELKRTIREIAEREDRSMAAIARRFISEGIARLNNSAPVER